MRLFLMALLQFGSTFLFSQQEKISQETGCGASCANKIVYPAESLGQSNECISSGNFVGRYWNPLPKIILKRIVGNSWKDDCPVPLEDFAYVQVVHWNFDGGLSLGELIYHKNLAIEIIDIFKELYEEQFPVERMVLIDNYDADDELSMDDNNSSAFCSRAITGKPGVFSMHSYGGTIDINPFLNPYVKEETILPSGAGQYLDRSQNIPGMIKEKGLCYRIFIKRGYTWGGEWSSLKDYQHFEKHPDKFIL
jgi:hypothetical protein